MPDPDVARSHRYIARFYADNTVEIRTADGRLLRTIEVPSSGPIARIALWRSRLVVTTDGDEALDRPSRLAVYTIRSGRLLRDWPLPMRMNTLDVSRGVVLLSSTEHRGLFALRLRDGRYGLVGLNQRVDMPQIGPRGVVFEDDLYKEDDGKGRVVMKFLPRRFVEHAIVAAARPVELSWRLASFAADVEGVSFVMKDPRGRCDRIGQWSVPWHYVTGITMMEKPTCPERHAPGGIEAVALGGSRIGFRTAYGGTQALIDGTVVHCEEHVVTRGGRGTGTSIGPVAADGPLLAFAVNGRDGRAQIRFVNGKHRSSVIVRRRGVIRRLTADGERLAVLRSGGAVEVLQRRTTLFSRRLYGARAVALRADTLAVLTHHRVGVFNVSTGSLLHSWRVPARTRAEIDVHYGVAVLTAGRSVYALRLATGRTVRLLRVSQPVSAQIEAPGIVYRYNERGHGFMGSVPFALIERALR